MSADARTARLVDARRLSAAHKRRHALRTIDEVRRRGDRVTFAGVAREAGVSGWFVRNQLDVRAAIEHALREQAAAGTPDKRAVHTFESTAGLRAELLLAREEIRDLRRERDQMRQQLRAHLGAEFDQSSRQDLVRRIADIESQNQDLLTGHALAKAAENRATEQLAAAESDLLAVRVANKRLMRR